MLRTQEPFSEAIQKREDASTSIGHLVYSHYPDMFTYQNSCHDSLVYVMPSDSTDSINGDALTKNTGSRWREDETEALVEIWRDKICQTRWWKQSKGVRVNKEMWEEISQLLAEREVYRTASQCQIRMKNLLQFYRQAVDNRRSEKSWDDLPEYFDIVDRIMTRREGNASTNEDEKIQRVTTSGLQDEESNQTHELNVENENANSSSTAPSSDRKSSEDPSSGSTPPAKKRPKNESENNKEESKKFPVTSTTSNTNENGFIPTRYSTAVRGLAPSTIPSYLTHDQTRWRHSKSICCEAPGSKRFCFGNEKDTIRHLPEFPINPSFISTKSYVRPLNQYIDSKQAHPSHTCTETESCHAQGCSHRSNLPKRTLYSATNLGTLNNEIPGQNNTTFRYIQDVMHLQFKQMETIIDIEKQRLDIEKQRLRDEQEAGNRNTAFLMEAVRILAESFRKTDSKPSSSE